MFIFFYNAFCFIVMNSEMARRLARNKRQRLAYASMNAEKKNELLAKGRNRYRLCCSSPKILDQHGAISNGKY